MKRVANCVLILLSILLITGIINAAKPPLFEIKTLEGEQYKLQDDLGKHPIILDFWAIWCKPCLRELPHLEEIYNEYKEKGLKVYAISIDNASSKSKIKPTLRRYKFSLPVLLDQNQSVIRKYNPTKNIPYLVIIGIDGNIVREFSGYKPGDEKLVEKLIKKEFEETE